MRKRWAYLLRPAPHDLALLALALTVALNLVITPDLGRTLTAVWPLLTGLALCALVARWPHTRARLLWIWAGLIVAVGGLCLLGLWGMKAKPHVLFPQLGEVLKLLLAARDHLIGRLSDSFHPNVIAGALVLLLPFGLAGALHPGEGSSPSWRIRILSILSGLIWLAGCMLVFLTQSRGAYLGLAAGLLVFVLLWPRALWVLAPVAALGALLLTLAGGWTRLGRVPSLVAAVFGLGWRSIVWANGLRVLASFPYTGVGLGCFGLVTAQLFPMAGAGSVDASHAHNLFLQVGIELGLPGLVAYLAMLGLSFFLLARAYGAFRRRKAPGLRLLTVACLAALVGMCVHGLVDVPTWGNKSAFLPWVVIGLSAALHRVSERD